ncbi:MAG: DinB family protein, partial [Gemmatimonadales bacterium]
MADASASALVITPDQFRQHWQGHRALTRRVIVAFPDDKLFSYSLGGMRPFSALAMEFLGMAVPTLQGVVTGEWKSYPSTEAKTKDDILR